MEEMQNDNIGYLAVSLGFYKTLFSAPGLVLLQKFQKMSKLKWEFLRVW